MIQVRNPISRDGAPCPAVSAFCFSFRACLAIALCVELAACTGGTSGGSGATPLPEPPPATESLTQADVQMLVQAAATAAQSNTMAIAVVDRLGRILAVYEQPGAPASLPGNFGAAVPPDELAVSLARTGAFFSNDQAPLSSRTVRFISGVHFPPGVMNTGSAALYGIENTNRGCNLAASLSATVSPATTIAGASPGFGITTGKADINDTVPTAVNPAAYQFLRMGKRLAESVSHWRIVTLRSMSPSSPPEWSRWAALARRPTALDFPHFQRRESLRSRALHCHS